MKVQSRPQCLQPKQSLKYCLTFLLKTGFTKSQVRKGDSIPRTFALVVLTLPSNIETRNSLCDK